MNVEEGAGRSSPAPAEAASPKPDTPASASPAPPEGDAPSAVPEPGEVTDEATAAMQVSVIITGEINR